MEVLFSNIEPRTVTRVIPSRKSEPVLPPAETGSRYQPGIRMYVKPIDRYVELNEIRSLEPEELKLVWQEVRMIADSYSTAIKPARKATAELFCAMCKYTSRKHQR